MGTLMQALFNGVSASDKHSRSADTMFIRPSLPATTIRESRSEYSQAAMGVGK